MAPVGFVDVLFSGIVVIYGVSYLIDVSIRKDSMKPGTKAAKTLAALGLVCTGLAVLVHGEEAALFWLMTIIPIVWAFFSESEVKASDLFPTFFGRRRNG